MVILTGCKRKPDYFVLPFNSLITTNFILFTSSISHQILHFIIHLYVQVELKDHHRLQSTQLQRMKLGRQQHQQEHHRLTTSIRSKAAHFVTDLTTVILNPISDKSSSNPSPRSVSFFTLSFLFFLDLLFGVC